MSAKNKHRKDMQFLKMDMLQMDFEDGSFEIVADKGTLDALMSDTSEKVIRLRFSIKTNQNPISQSLL